MLMVKVADFGLSQELEGKPFTKIRDESIPLPLRWMSIESLEGKIFSLKTDMVRYLSVSHPTEDIFEKP